jgi:NhaP-type Na+/H+ or K+/H+ antiporter
MKKNLIILAIYLLGCVCSYKYGKYLTLIRSGKWTQKDRAVVLTLSVLSWITVAAEGCAHVVITYNPNEKAEW